MHIALYFSVICKPFIMNYTAVVYIKVLEQTGHQIY